MYQKAEDGASLSVLSKYGSAENFIVLDIPANLVFNDSSISASVGVFSEEVLFVVLFVDELSVVLLVDELLFVALLSVDDVPSLVVVSDEELSLLVLVLVSEVVVSLLVDDVLSLDDTIL